MYHFQYGFVLQELGRAADAAVCYREAARLAPRFFGAHYNLGVVLQGQGEIDGAIDCYRTAVKHNPEMVQALNNLGILLIAKGEYQEAEKILRQSIAADPGFPFHYNSLGNALAKLDRPDEALVCYEHALRINPGLLEALLNVAEQLSYRGDHLRAIEYYDQALALQPDNESVRFKRDSLDQRNPSRAPTEYVVQVFDEMAETFDDLLVDTLEYKTPKILHNQLVPWLGEQGKKISALDLGCGTGLFGIEIKQWCDYLKGLDLSPGMLAKAAQRSLYDDLEVGEIVAYLRGETRKYDLVAAVDVLGYLGDLADTFAGVGRTLTPGGVFAFSVEQLLDDQGDYLLRKTGRYSHSRAYVSRLAGLWGFNIRDAISAPLRKDSGADIIGCIFVLTRTAPDSG